MNEMSGHDIMRPGAWEAAPSAHSGLPGEFERIMRLAGLLAGAPIVLLSTEALQLTWTDPGLTVAYGELERLHKFCETAAAGQAEVAINDLSREPRLWSHPAVRGELGLRFLARLPLAGVRGQPTGALSILDIRPRADFPNGQGAALAEVAALAAQAAEREADAVHRLLTDPERAEQIDAAAVRAPSCELALTGMLTGLCRRHRATAGFVGKFNDVTQTLHKIGHYQDDSPLGAYFIGLACKALTPETSHAAMATQSGSARALAFSGRKAQSAYAVSLEAIQAGLRAEIIQPLHILDERYGVVLQFDAPRADLERIADDLGSMLRAARPALYRKVAERRMRLLGTALDRANDAVLITEAGPLGSSGPTIAYANESFCRQSGYSLEEVLGRPHDLLSGPGTDQEAITRLRQEMRRWRPARAELLNYRKDGSAFWAELDLTPITDRAGLPTHWVSIQRDVTERRRIEAAQRRHEASFQMLFQDNPLPMVVMERDERTVIEVNDAAVGQYGWLRTEFLGKRLADLSPNGEEPPPLGPGKPVFTTHIRSDGSVMEVQAFMHETVYAGREALIAVLWDVTNLEAARRDMHHANELLRERTLQLHARTEEVAEAQRLARLTNWRVPVDWRDPQWMQAIPKLMDMPRDMPSLNASDRPDRIHEEDRDVVRRAFENAALNGASKNFEYRVVMSDGQVRHLRAEVRPVLDSDGDVIELFGYSQDVSEGKRAEQALLRNESLRALGQLTGGVAHDFNNLLTVVILNLEEAQDMAGDEGELAEILQPALHAAVRGAELTSQLLSYARRAPLRPERVRPDEFLGALRPLLTRVLGERFDLQVVLRHNGGSAMVDPAQLDSAVMNLVINARDAMPHGGAITLETRSVTLDADTPGFQDEVTPGHYVVIGVADQGEGIPAHLLARVFEPFFTTKEAGKGSGLGLSMVFGFARQSGGHVTIDSQPGRGTTVRLYLPVPDAAGEEDAVPLGIAEDWRAKGLRALVVEDQESVLTVVTRMLRQLGFEVTAASSASTALEHVTEGKAFDLLFTDIVLPGAMDGVGLAGEVAQRAPETRILLTSGFTEHNLGARDETAPGIEFLMKPYKRQDLQEKFNMMFPRMRLPTEPCAAPPKS